MRDYNALRTLTSGTELQNRGPRPRGTARLWQDQTCLLRRFRRYFKPRDECWDGYLGQKLVVFNDFYRWLRYDELLRLCDRYPIRVPVKGAYIDFVSKEIYVTSNKYIEDWYDFRMEEDRDALCRRITT